MSLLTLNHSLPDLSGNPFYATQWSEKIDFVEPKGLGAEGGNSCPTNCKMYFVKCKKKPESMTQVLYFIENRTKLSML